MVVVSAQEATRTRLCAAERCEQDAETNSRLCWRCAKKDSVRLHVAPVIDTGPTLRCCTCGEYKPDDAFALQRATKMRARRNRNSECRQCQAERKRLHRLLHPPATRCKATNQGQRDRNDQRTGQPCRAYAAPGSPYCSVHKSLA